MCSIYIVYIVHIVYIVYIVHIVYIVDIVYVAILTQTISLQPRQNLPLLAAAMYSYIGAELTEATLQLHPPTDVGTSGGSNGASSTTEVARPYDEATLHLPTNVRSSGGTSGASSTTHDEVWLVTEVARPCDEVWLVTPDVMVHNERERDSPTRNNPTSERDSSTPNNPNPSLR